MKLTDLDPRFLRYNQNHAGVSFDTVDSITVAQGVSFLCPKCFAENGGAAGTHSVICWSRSRGVPETAQPGPGRWALDGTGFHNLTLNGDAIGGGGARSVQLNGGCEWHGFITNGEACAS
jgi:hypothetical protein